MLVTLLHSALKAAVLCYSFVCSIPAGHFKCDKAVIVGRPASWDEAAALVRVSYTLIMHNASKHAVRAWLLQPTL